MTTLTTKIKYGVASHAGVVGQQQFEAKAKVSEFVDWKYTDKLNAISTFDFTAPNDEYNIANIVLLRNVKIPLLKPFNGIITSIKTDNTNIYVKAKELATHLERRIFTLNEENVLAYTDVDWLDPAWKFRRKLLINKNYMTDDLAGFVLQIHNKHEDDDPHKKMFPSFADGRDFRITDTDGKTIIPYEIEYWDNVNNDLVIRFKPPALGRGMDNIGYIYYGNSGASDGQDLPSTWSNGFAAVYHFQESTGNYKDSVSNGTKNAGVRTNVTTVTGHHGNAASFNGVDSKIECGNDASIADIFAGGGAIECWINPLSSGEGTLGRIVEKGRYRLLVTNEVSGFMRLRFSYEFSTATGSWQTDRIIPVNEKTHIAVEYNRDSVSNSPVFYINGEKTTTNLVTTPVGTALSDNTHVLVIGNHSAQTVTFDGWIDELQLHSVTRGDFWWRTRYRNETMDSEQRPFLMLIKEQQQYVKAANLIAQDILDSANTDMPMQWRLGTGFPTDIVSITFDKLNHYDALLELSYVLGKDLFFDYDAFEVYIDTKGKTLSADTPLDLMIIAQPEKNVENFANILNLVGKTDDRGKDIETTIEQTPTLRYNFEKVIRDGRIQDDTHIESIGNDLISEFKVLTHSIEATVPTTQFFRFALQSGDIIKINDPRNDVFGDFRVMEIQADKDKARLTLENAESAKRRLKSRSIQEIISILIKRST